MEDGTTSGARDALLTCWKDIANYLGKSIRTVQRWEQMYGLPVRRPKVGPTKTAVVARTIDLNAWLDSNWLGRSRRNGQHRKMSALPNQSVFDLILTAQQLRNRHQELMLEATATLAILVARCGELVSGRIALTATRERTDR